MPFLKCPNCGLPLGKQEKTFACPKGHSFDIAKKGYVNLLLANQGRHGEEGDSKEMVEARKRFLSTGAYETLRKALIQIIQSLNLPNGSSFADIACGEGYYTNAIHSACGFSSVGIDISKAAVHSAASARNQLGIHDIEYVVGNLDYLPLLDNSQDLLLNCFAPINGLEFVRVCKPNGYYIRVLPDTYHLWEMKGVLYEEVRANEPKEPEIAGFSLLKEVKISDVITLDERQIRDLFMMTPYYYKSSVEAKERLFAKEKLETRIAFVIRLYQKNV